MTYKLRLSTCSSIDSSDDDCDSTSEGMSRERLSVAQSAAIGIPPLDYAVMVPICPYMPIARQAKRFLESISSVVITSAIELAIDSEDDPAYYYIISLYSRRQFQSQAEQRGIPTNQKDQPTSTTTSVDEQAPVLQTQHRYSEFVSLRTKLKFCLERKKTSKCGYCRGLKTFIQTSPAQPSLKVKLVSSVDERKSILTTFLNDVITRANSPIDASSAYVHKYHHIQSLLYWFLNPNGVQL